MGSLRIGLMDTVYPESPTSISFNARSYPNR